MAAPERVATKRAYGYANALSGHESARVSVAVIVTEPLTTNETWHAFAPGELRVFVEGTPLN